MNVDDLQPQGLLHAAVLRSPVAHARLCEIDVTAALALAGVHAVLTATDFHPHVPEIPLRMEPRPELARFVQPVLAHGKLRYVGEPVALVVADSVAVAEDAIALLHMDFEELPAIADHVQSAAAATLLFEQHGTNHAMTIFGVRGDADSAFKQATYTRKQRFSVQRHAAMPLEGRGVLAEWDSVRGRLKVSGAMKVPFAIRALLAKLMSLAESQIEVIENDAGGGFGARGEFYPEDFLIPFAACKLARPVKWIEDRREHLMATSHSREVTCELEIACMRDAITQGLGGTLLEQITYDEHGQLLTGSLAGYLLPGAEDFPKIRVITLENYPSPINPLGAKGAGEGGIIPVGGVIANAVAAALAPPGAPVGTPLGASPCTLPLTPARVWQLLQSTSR